MEVFGEGDGTDNFLLSVSFVVSIIESYPLVLIEQNCIYKL